MNEQFLLPSVIAQLMDTQVDVWTEELRDTSGEHSKKQRWEKVMDWYEGKIIGFDDHFILLLNEDGRKMLINKEIIKTIRTSTDDSGGGGKPDMIGGGGIPNYICDNCKKKREEEAKRQAATSVSQPEPITYV